MPRPPADVRWLSPGLWRRADQSRTRHEHGPRPLGAGRATVASLPPEDQPEIGQPKELPPQFRRQVVDYKTKEPAGTIIIDTPSTFLYYVNGDGTAIRYGIGVGRDGFTWKVPSESPAWRNGPTGIRRQR